MGIDARMFSRYRGEKPTSDQLKLWSWDLCSAIGGEHFFIDAKEGRAALDLSSDYADDGDESLKDEGKVWHQDGDSIRAEKDEWLVEVSIWTRYYGPGYERGNWQVIIHVAEWMELHVGPVWYGGDSSGVCASPFGKNERAAMVAHALSESGRDYYKAFEPAPFKTPPPCSLCVKERGHTRHGWGQGYIKTHCAGCARSFESRDDGVTWAVVTRES